jgi:hypothetical protein
VVEICDEGVSVFLLVQVEDWYVARVRDAESAFWTKNHVLALDMVVKDAQQFRHGVLFV